ncbi:LysR family transcriptional regulator [Curvibacter sp. HBC28]|uniref:LysR family transcriptional regulator n=1 Tax=Curvibacter microcysteis TaxID=3026419 RepID=A0ABT5MA35_9BURK|nr:LysR family transcriptional regulator [Curvibacter sp. HBC28]MDD0813291.1 LysR family transcriptional regulator [Curvibacter sp. HBC28]
MKRQLPPLNALRAFEAAARLGRMSAAALELSVTPGAISRQVQQLERSLNVKLFEGSKNKPLLTPAAQTLLSALSPALDQMEAAVKAISNANSGVLDVACFSTFMVKWLIPKLFDFNALHSDMKFGCKPLSALMILIRSEWIWSLQSKSSHPACPTQCPCFPSNWAPSWRLRLQTVLH